MCPFLQCIKEGDIVVGKVAFKRPFCIIVTLTMLEFGCNRDFTDLDVQVHELGFFKHSIIINMRSCFYFKSQNVEDVITRSILCFIVFPNTEKQVE